MWRTSRQRKNYLYLLLFELIWTSLFLAFHPSEERCHFSQWLSRILSGDRGCDRAPVSICDQFSLAQDKWRSLPPLSEPKYLPGSCVLSSKKVFCFCGTRGHQERVNRVESLQVHSESKWTVLHFDFKLPKTYHLIGVSMLGYILVFGGASITSYNMYKCTEEGEVIEDMTEERGEIPGLMCGGVVQVYREKIYAVGWRREGS